MAGVQVIPAINASTWEEALERLKRVEPHTKWVHLDVADGTFTPNTLWHEPEDLGRIHTKLSIEVHLMIKNPEMVIDDWIKAGVKRIIVHVEAINDLDLIKEKCEKAKVALMLSITPEVSWKWLLPYIEEKHMKSFQVLSVHPGLAGQKFIEEGTTGNVYIESSYEKVRHLREHCADCDIEVDGGIKVGIAKKCKEAGANIISAATAVFSAKDVREALEELKKDVT